jgi:hypothetical protein
MVFVDETLAGWSGEALADVTHARRMARAVEIAEFHRAADAGVWMGRGFRSPSTWLATATGETVGACKRALHLGKRLTSMPDVARAFASGDLSEPALGLLADAWSEQVAEAFARDEEMLLGWAIRLPYHDAKIVIGAWTAHTDPDHGSDAERDRYDRRRLHLSEPLDGVSALDGVLDAEGAAYVRRALQFLSTPADGDSRTPAQRRADALVSMARFVLQHHETPAGTKRRRPDVVVQVRHRDLVAQLGGSLDGYLLSGDAVRRLCCDAGIHRLVTAGQSTILDYGRRTRVISDSLYEALAVRDGGCRILGCDVPAEFCDVHHAVHWGDLGETEPDNLMLLCWHHHHTAHEQHWSLEPLGAGRFDLHAPTGYVHPTRPPRITLLSLE